MSLLRHKLRRSDRDNLRRAQQAAKRDIKAAERMADEAKHAARAECEWRIGEMRAKMQADGASSSTRCRFRWRQRRGALMPQPRRSGGEVKALYNKMEGIICTRVRG